MNKERSQDIKNRGYRRRAISPNDWATILKDVEELIAAVEELQAENERLQAKLGGWDQLFMSIFRISDGYCVEDTFSEGNDTLEEMMGYMKERLDADMAEYGEGEWFYEEDEA